MKKENFELQSRINKLKIDYDNAIEQVKQKDDKIQQLSKEIQLLVSIRSLDAVYMSPWTTVTNFFRRTKKYQKRTKAFKKSPNYKTKSNYYSTA